MLGTGWIVFWVCIGVFSAFGWCWGIHKTLHKTLHETPSESTVERNNFLSWGSTANNDYSLI